MTDAELQAIKKRAYLDYSHILSDLQAVRAAVSDVCALVAYVEQLEWKVRRLEKEGRESE